MTQQRIYIGAVQPSNLGTPGTLAPIGGTTGTYGQPHRGAGVALSRRQWRNRRRLDGGGYEGDEGEDPQEDEDDGEPDPAVLGLHLGTLQDIAVTGLEEGFFTEGVAFRALDHIANTDALGAADELLGGIEDLVRVRVLAGDRIGDLSGVIPLVFMAVAKPITKAIKNLSEDPRAIPRTVESSRRLADNVGKRASTVLDALRDVPDAWERGGADEDDDADVELPELPSASLPRSGRPPVVDDGTENRPQQATRGTRSAQTLQTMGNMARGALDLLTPGDGAAGVGGLDTTGVITPDDPQASIRAWKSRQGPIQPQDPTVAIDTDGLAQRLQ